MPRSAPPVAVASRESSHFTAMRTPIPFIVGSPRSGTTLLRLMLDAHPELAIPPETGFFGELASGPDIGRSIGPLDFADLLIGSENWQDFCIEADALRAALLAIPAFNLADGYRAFYATYAARFSKPRYGDKTPANVFHIERIERLLPEAHFIHIIRDGRDAAESLRNQWFSPGNKMETQAKFWARHVLAAQASASKVRKYLEVRFEDLILDTEATLSKVCDFIEIDFAGAMMDYHEHAPKRLQEHQGREFADGMVLTKARRFNQQIRTTLPPQKQLVFGWRRTMSLAEIREFQSVAGALLGALGYDVIKD
jgi:hypothetical protein